MKNHLKQGLLFQAEKSCKCKERGSDAEFSSAHYMVSAANVDGQKRMLTSLARIKLLEWAVSRESAVGRCPGVWSHAKYFIWKDTATPSAG